MNGVDHTIVGVLGPRFRFGNQQADVYTPIARRNPLYINDRTVHDILCVARLRPEVVIGQARAEMNTVQQHIDELNPNTERGQGAYVISLKQSLVGDIGGTLLLLLGAVGLVLLIACANVANLLLARSTARTREFAIRLALGASRAQIVRQLVAESVVLSVSGATPGPGDRKMGCQGGAGGGAGKRAPHREHRRERARVVVRLGVSVTVGIAGPLSGAQKLQNRTCKRDSRKEAGAWRAAIRVRKMSWWSCRLRWPWCC